MLSSNVSATLLTQDAINDAQSACSHKTDPCTYSQDGFTVSVTRGKLNEDGSVKALKDGENIFTLTSNTGFFDLTSLKGFYGKIYGTSDTGETAKLTKKSQDSAGWSKLASLTFTTKQTEDKKQSDYSINVTDSIIIASTAAVPMSSSIAAVPEPSSIALLGMGLFGLVASRRKKKQA